MKTALAIILMVALLATAAAAHAPAFMYSPTNPTACDTITFSVIHPDHDETYKLTFGDGNEAIFSGGHPSHGMTTYQYAASGTYQARLYKKEGFWHWNQLDGPVTITVIACPTAPEAPPVSGYFPYTADPNAPGTCEGALTQEADIETHILEGRPLLISLESCGPNGCAFVDTFRVYYLYETGDPSCNSAATVRQYFSRCAMDSRSGTGPLVIPVNGGVQRIRVIGAKDEVTYPAATQLRVTITEAYTGRLVWPLTLAETDQAVTHGDETIYDHTLGLDTDLAGCRPNNAEGSGWIFGIPTPLPTVTPRVA